MFGRKVPSKVNGTNLTEHVLIPIVSAHPQGHSRPDRLQLPKRVGLRQMPTWFGNNITSSLASSSALEAEPANPGSHRVGLFREPADHTLLALQSTVARSVCFRWFCSRGLARSA
jgi:hypothetical protein